MFSLLAIPSQREVPLAENVWICELLLTYIHELKYIEDVLGI